MKHVKIQKLFVTVLSVLAILSLFTVACVATDAPVDTEAEITTEAPVEVAPEAIPPEENKGSTFGALLLELGHLLLGHGETVFRLFLNGLFLLGRSFLLLGGICLYVGKLLTAFGIFGSDVGENIKVFTQQNGFLRFRFLKQFRPPAYKKS